MKKALCTLLVICLMLPLAGCWNYRGLNEMTIVAGMAIDSVDGQYLITFEVMDMQRSTKTEGPSSELVLSKGPSVFEAIRNAKRQLASKLYFGNMQIVIISSKIAEENGINALIDFLLRDAEMRETMEMVVSREETARELLMGSKKDTGAVSYDMIRIIREDASVTGSVFSAQIYHIYNKLKTPGVDVALPSFYVAEEPGTGKKHIETYGSAVFRKDKLAGFLSAEETKMLLMAYDILKGGLVTVYMPSITPNNITLELKNVDSDMSYEAAGQKINVTLKTSIQAYLGEFPHNNSKEDLAVIGPVTTATEKMLQNQIQDVIKKLQTQYQSDVLGMGSSIYRKNLSLWKQISGQWDEIYRTVPVEVTVKLHITNTAMMRES